MIRPEKSKAGAAWYNPPLIQTNAGVRLATGNRGKDPHLIAVLEERELRDRFGEEYEAYCRKVSRFLPRMRSSS